MSSGAVDSSADTGRQSAGILGRPYRRLTFGIVSVIFLIAFEGMAVATAMPVAVRDLDGLALSVLLFEYSSVEEQGANSAAVQLTDALGSSGCIGLGGVIFAYARVRAADVMAFIAIFTTMAVLAAVGTVLARRGGKPRSQPAGVALRRFKRRSTASR